MAEIVLINPRFQVSYWGLEHALPLLGKKCNIPTACLPLIAALTPAGHSVTIVDENVEPIDYDRLAKADIVGLAWRAPFQLPPWTARCRTRVQHIYTRGPPRVSVGLRQFGRAD